MVYELVWIRMFAIALGSSTYSFTLMVAAFITGIALGSLAVGAFSSLRKHPLTEFAQAEIVIAFALLASIPMYERLPHTFWVLSTLMQPTAANFWLHNLMKYSLCFGVMVVPTIFFGMTLPFAIKACAHRDDRIGRESGVIYGWNTVGTVVGALLTGLVLIPIIGLRHSLELALIVNVLLGAVLLWASGGARTWRASLGIPVLAVVIMATLHGWHPASFAVGTFREQGLAPPWREFRRSLSSMRVAYYGEDGNATVAVLAVPTPTMGTGLILKVNGKSDASSHWDMPTQILLGQIPMTLKPAARDALVVGLGSGMTAGSVLTHPDARVDCVEISPAVAAALPCFDEANHRVRTNPRFHLMIEDALTYAAVTPKRYDAVISEPSNPWIAGVGNLFSEEFFRSADRVLKPGGLLAQWFHAYEMSDDLVAVVLRTVRKVFPYAYIFQATQTDYIIVAGREPIRLDVAGMEREFRIPAVRDDLRRIKIDSPLAVLARQTCSPAKTAELAGKGITNTENLPVLEYRAPLALWTKQTARSFLRADERTKRPGALLRAQYPRG